MKKFFALCLFLSFASFVVAQKVIENPDFGIGTDAVSITKIELSETETALTFQINLEPGRTFGIAGKSFIQIVGEPDTLFMIRKNAPEPVNGWITVPEEGLSYTLYFPAIDLKTEKIDFGEPTSQPWMIYDIVINQPPFSSILPEVFSGNWFSSQSGKWEFSFFENTAIAGNQVWEYVSVKNLDGMWKIVLKANEKEKTIYAKSNQNNCLFGEDPESMTSYSSEFTGIKTPGKDDFQMPVINPGEVTYSGYIRNFTTRLGINTGLLTVMNPLTREMNKYVLTISENGYFTVQFPLALPQKIQVSLPKQSTQLFMVPGENLFHLSNSGIPEQSSLFMGEGAELNYDLEKLPRLGFNSPEILESFLKMNFKEYVGFVKNEKEKALSALENQKSLSVKARNLGLMNIQFQYADALLRFNQNKRLGTFYKNRTLKENEQVTFEEEKLSFEDFKKLLKNTPVNNEKALICSSYKTLLSSLKFTDVELGQNVYYLKMQNLKNKMLNEGLKLTAKEVEMFDFIKLYFVENFNAEATTNFSKLYMQTWNKFRTDHAEEIQEYMNNYYNENLKKNLKNIFETESGLAVELTAVNNYYLPTLNKAEVPKTKAFNQIKKIVKNPALKEFVISDYYKKKAEYDLLNSGGEAVLNTEGDKIFQNIIKNYKGKVIYIDFWATWCAPCRAGIEKIKPLKEELKNEDIVFVYITNPTSPEKTYKKMKPNIKGEHYKLNSDEWTHLTAKFNIYGIPHYALVNKNGRIVNAHLPHLENDELKKVLMEQVEK